MTNRRTYLRRLGAGVGLALLAGCVDEDAAGDEGNSGDSQPDETDDTDEPTPTESIEALDSPPAPVDERLTERGVPNYDGEIVSEFERDVVWVGVGAGETGLTFDPPVVQIEPGTEIAWEWTGKGGAHNVVAAEPEGAFNSGDPIEGSSGTFYAVMFDEPGSYIYNCLPHAGIGMWGAVVVGNGGAADPDGTTVRKPIEEDSTGSDDESDPDFDGARGVADRFLRDNDAQQYDEQFVDLTGQDSATIDVGGGENALAFSPPAIIVDPGTEIVWEWTGKGGAHNVVSAEESTSEFDSGEIVQSETHTYTAVVETTGAHLYYCTPHQAVGMHGAIVVEE